MREYTLSYIFDGWDIRTIVIKAKSEGDAKAKLKQRAKRLTAGCPHRIRNVQVESSGAA